MTNVSKKLWNYIKVSIVGSIVCSIVCSRYSEVVHSEVVYSM